MPAMARHLRYWWTFGIFYDRLILPISLRREKNQRAGGDLRQTPCQAGGGVSLDGIVGAGRDKRYPYAGGGSFLAAAKATHRRWLATERNEATVSIARKQLAGVSAG